MNIGPGTSSGSMNMDMDVGDAACLQYRDLDSRGGGKTHITSDHLYINTLQYLKSHGHLEKPYLA